MLGGFPVIYGINPFETETVPNHNLGSIGIDQDGRKYRYAQVNADNALVAGNLLASPAEATDSQSLIVAAASVGATTVTTTDTTTVTANEFADGYLITTGEGGGGNGLMYRIKSHPAATAAVLTITLYDPIEVALTASTQIDLVHNPFNGVIQWPTTATGGPVGVAVTAAAVNTYTWIQTGGPGTVLADAAGAIAVGQMVVASNGTAGAVEDVASTTQPIVGYALTGIAASENGAAFLTID